MKVQTFREVWQDAVERDIIPSWERLVQPWALAFGGEDGLRETARLFDAIGAAELQRVQTGSPTPPRAESGSPVPADKGLVSTKDYFLRLAMALEGSKAATSEFDWSVCMLGQDQTETLAALDQALAGDPETGVGKNTTVPLCQLVVM
jgi:hypothetical protein